MKVSALIVEDEPVARAGLRAMLATFDWISIVGEAADGPAAVRLVNSLKPELLLLDIELPGFVGTEVLRQIEHHPFVLFTTAYAQHAVTAFELGAVDYILKPFGAARLGVALERVRGAIGEPAAHSSLERFGSTYGSGPISRIFVRSGAALLPVLVENIQSFSADGDYVVAHVAKGRHMLHLSLARLESRLDAEKFIRIHRTHIVNLDHVKAFKRSIGGQMHAEMKDGTRLPVSRTKAQELRSLGL